MPFFPLCFRSPCGPFEAALRDLPRWHDPDANLGGEFLWQRFYAWHPVFPSDEGGIFWLEIVWRRRHSTGRWQYRSFRTEAEKLTELIDREI